MEKLNFQVIKAITNFCLTPHIDYNKIVFSSSFNTSFDYNARYLFEYIIENNSEYKVYFVINDEAKRKKLISIYGERFINTLSYDGAKEALSAGAWATSAGLPVYIPFANKRRFIINLWHGMPFKKICYDSNELNRFVKPIHKLFFSKNYSAISATSKYFQKIMASAFDVNPEIVHILGQPRNDMLFKSGDKINILKELGVKFIGNPKLVLYAPTFRDTNQTQYFPFTDFNKEQFDFWLKENNIFFFIRPHKSESAKVEIYKGQNIFIIDDKKVEDIMSILNIFDLLISDYSGICCDFLILEKPILLLPYDLEEYLKIRGTYMTYENYAMGPCPKDYVKFKEDILELLINPDYFSKERKIQNNKFNEVRQNSCYLHTELIIKELNKRKGEFGQHE